MKIAKWSENIAYCQMQKVEIVSETFKKKVWSDLWGNWIYFLGNGITNLDVFKEVSESTDFKELVPCMGTRVQIKIKLKEFREKSFEKISEQM